LERPVAEHPARLDERMPRDVIAHAVRRQAVILLERGDRSARFVAVVAPLPGRRSEPGGRQPPLEGPDRITSVTAPQGELGAQAGAGRNSLSSWSNALFGLAPTSRLATSPSLKTRSVGMLITL
jgi:hypothetical protein